MCIVFFSFGRTADPAGFSVLANRDEFVDRPTEVAHLWDGANGMVAGRDLKAGGTWLGVNAAGRFAALTNVRDPGRNRAGMRSRGGLVRRWVSGGQTVDAFSSWLRRSASEYNPFNLLFGERGEFAVYDGVTGQVLGIAPGVHALSNGSFTSPWPKMLRGLAAFSQALPVDPLSHDNLLGIARDDTRAADDLLPATGVPASLERQLSGIFIPPLQLGCARYGTVSTTLLNWQPGGGFLKEWNWRAEAVGSDPVLICL